MQIEGSKTSRFTSRVYRPARAKKSYVEAAEYYPLTVDVEEIESEEAAVLVLRGDAAEREFQLIVPTTKDESSR